MIDFHSHILPNIDDGAKNVHMSLEMLVDSYKQGVKTVVATPHCYIREDSDIDTFLKKRDSSYKLLKEAINNETRPLPNIILGAEVQILSGNIHFEKLKPLCIENTDYILIEMPYTKWNEDCYDNLYLLYLKGMKPIIAHIERFLNKKKDFINLYSLDLVYQINADSFLSPFIRRHIPELFFSGTAQLLGSDMHNTSKRPSHFKKACDRIVKSYGKDRLKYMMDNAEKILNNEPSENKRFEKMSYFKKLNV